MNDRAAIFTPIYKATLEAAEMRSLEQCNRVLASAHPWYLIAPIGLDTRMYTEHFPEARVEFFDASYFLSTQTYNKLMMAEETYSRFAQFDYLLVYQPDAWVFRDELDTWCAREFSYVGAPWLGRSRVMLGATLSFRLAIRPFLPWKWGYGVGNGGFSLRHIPTFLRTLREIRDLSTTWHANEDYFWGLLVPELRKDFCVAPWREAVKFSFELEPRRALAINKGALPFGCHAWAKYAPDFWRQYIPADERPA